MKIKGIIFDLDGVLVHTDKYHYLAWKEMADKEDIYFNEEINHLLRGVSRLESLNIILRNAKKTYTEEQKLELVNFKNKIYREYLSKMTKNDVSSDVLKTLNELKQRNFKLAVGSSSKNATFITEKVDLSNYFDVVIDGNNILNSKPHPEVFLKASEKLGLKPHECIVIEDAYSGVEAALNGGFISVGINQAKNHEQVHYKIDSINEIANVISLINNELLI